jgi:hypothetical protein
MQRSGRPSRRVDLEELVVIIGVITVDLHGEDGVWGGELDAFPRCGVLNLMRHISDVRLPALIE